MDQQQEQLSRSIDSVSGALAQWTVSRFGEADPTLPERYGPEWRPHWVAEVQSRLGALAQAVAVGRPVFFAESVVWSGAVFAAHAVETADLVASLRHLDAVVADELPTPVAAAVKPCIDAALERLQNGRPVGDSALRADAPHGDIAMRYFEALLSGRGDEAATLVLAAAAGGVSVADLYMHVLTPVQTEVGRLWHEGDISIADEHLATAATVQVMARLRSFFPEVKRTRRRVLAAGVGGNLHEIGIRMVADFFAMDGWDVVFIGANVPRGDLLEAALHHKVDLLLVSVGTTHHLRELGGLLREIRATTDASGLKILVGGPPLRLAPDLAEALGADGSAASAAEAVTLADRLVPCKE